MTREGLVMEVNETHSIFMTHEGEFVKGVPTTVADVGEYATFTPYKEKFNPKQAILAGPFVAIAASSLILFGSLFSDLPEAYAYVDLENGERIELGIDEDGNVVHIEGTQIEDDWENKPLAVVLVEIAETSPVAAFSHGNMRDGEVRSHVTKAIELAEEVEPTLDETETVSEPTTPVEVTDDSEDTEAADEVEATDEEKNPSVVAPGKAGTTPGQSGTTPGKSGKTPSEGAEPPGKAGTAPGKSGDTPGKNGTAPGKSDDSPGKSDKAPGQLKDKSGNGNKSKSNNSEKKQGNSGSDNSSPQMKKFNTGPAHNKSNNGNK